MGLFDMYYLRTEKIQKSIQPDFSIRKVGFLKIFILVLWKAQLVDLFKRLGDLSL